MHSSISCISFSASFAAQCDKVSPEVEKSDTKGRVGGDRVTVYDGSRVRVSNPCVNCRPGEINVMKPQNIAQLASICTSLNWFADGLLSNLDMKKHSDENARFCVCVRET